MHHLPNVFDRRKHSKKKEETSSPRHKLQRCNAVKNFDYTPPHRARSLDLPRELLYQTSIRVDGNRGEVNSLIQSMGFSGPGDFEIPRADWDAMKNRSSSDIIPRPPRGDFDYGEPQETENFLNTSHLRFRNGDKKNEEPKLREAAVPFLPVPGAVSRRGGVKGDRPPLLNPPPPMSFNVPDGGQCRSWEFGGRKQTSEMGPNFQKKSENGAELYTKFSKIFGGRMQMHEWLPYRAGPDGGCSTWELFRGLAPDDHSSPHSPCLDACQLSGNEEGDKENALRESLNSVRIGDRSESCSFTTNDDDSSSTTTEPLSIISPNGGCIWNITQWDKGKQLGKGSFGTVYEGMSSEAFFFAVKEVSLLEQGSQAKQSILYLEHEIELLSQFQHENIVRYLGTAKDDSNLYIFLELMTHGSLASLYGKYRLRDSHVCAFTRQILLGLKYLHDKNVVHRDIKCANILVGTDRTVKLADFGLAKATKLNDLKSCKGSAFWMAPEVVNHKNQGYGLAADIWSLGCTVLEMLTGNVPYHPMECMQALFRIGQGKPPPIPDSLSKDAKDLIQLCLRVNPEHRPTASELLDHPFVRRPLYVQAGFESPMPRRY